MFTRLHWRIAISYVVLITLVLTVLGVYLVSELRRYELNVLETQLVCQARLVADDARYHIGVEGTGQLDPLAKQLGGEVGARITLIAADGTVLGDSEHDPVTMDNHATRPEVVQALQLGSGESQRHSKTLEKDLLYVAVPIEQGGTVLGVARVALPVHEVQASLNQVALVVGAVLVVAALLSIVLAILLARVTTSRIEALTAASRRLIDGTLSEPISVEGRDEVSLLARSFNEMASKLQSHIRAVEDEREHLSVVLSHLADGVIIVDPVGVVLLINPAACRLLDIPPDRARGRSVIAVLRDHELVAMIHEAAGNRGRDVGPRLLERSGIDGKRALQVLASPMPAAADREPRVMLVLQDVTALRETEAVRRDFVANVSHELRTPVAVLKALVETLEDGAREDPEAAREFLERMHIEVDGLAYLVEELLELSRIESGRVALRRAPVDLGKVVANAAERLRPHAERHGVELAVAASGVMPAVEADAERIEQVVVNLVHNAVKFTPPGGRVTVSVARRGDEVAVSVADTGAGIAPEALPRVFERFYKADRGRGGGGTGLGLAIAKHLVQVHGGRIWAESAGPGQGATFVFTLPLARAAANA